MSNPYFIPNMSSNEIFYNQNVDLCLTDVVDGKAEANHTHTEYATTSHTHTEYATGTALAALETEVDGKAEASHTHTALETAINGKANAVHSHSYNDLSDKPTIPEGYTHPANHPASMITGLSTVATSGSYDDLSNKPTIPESYVHPTVHPASMITGLSDVATSGSYNDLSDKPAIPEAYAHPTSHPASMITGLSDVATSGNYNDLSNKPTIPDAYVHPTVHPASMITGLSTVATSGSYNDLSDKPTIPTIPTIPSSLPANGGNADTVDNKHASDFATANHTHSEQMLMRGVTTSGNGSAYTAMVDGIMELTNGVSFIMIPHTVSTVQVPTLNVNNLGAKNIRRRISNSTVTTTVGSSANWLGANKPVWVIFDGNYWIVDFDVPNANDIYGTVAINKGGTGATTAVAALENLGVKCGTWAPTAVGISGSNTISATAYNTQRGTYTKIGNTVIISFYVYATFPANYTSYELKINGCPFAPASTAYGGGSCSGYYANANTIFTGWQLQTNCGIYGRGQTVSSAANVHYQQNLYCGTQVIAAGTIMFEVE